VSLIALTILLFRSENVHLMAEKYQKQRLVNVRMYIYMYIYRGAYIIQILKKLKKIRHISKREQNAQNIIVPVRNVAPSDFRRNTKKTQSSDHGNLRF